MNTFESFPAQFVDDAGELAASFDYRSLVRTLRRRGVKDDWPITIRCQYRSQSDG